MAKDSKLTIFVACEYEDFEIFTSLEEAMKCGAHIDQICEMVDEDGMFVSTDKSWKRCESMWAGEREFKGCNKFYPDNLRECPDCISVMADCIAAQEVINKRHAKEEERQRKIRELAGQFSPVDLLAEYYDIEEPATPLS